MILPGPLVEAAWLADHLDEVQVVDVRWSIPTGPMIDAYRSGHIPGALFANMDEDLSDPPGPRGRHPLPSAERFAAARSRIGLDGRPVVAYDDKSGAVSGRLWWMLDAIGLQAAVLNGGINAWTGPLESGETQAAQTECKVVPWPEDCLVEVGQVEDSLADNAVLLDARSAERFAGKENPIDKRPGHIPGSTSRPWTSNVGENGLLLSDETLRTQLANQGVREDADLICSCGSGVTGCLNLLAAKIAGVKKTRLYVGSWSEWSQDPARPIGKSADADD